MVENIINENQKEQPAADAGAGVQPTTAEMYERTTALVERLEAANKAADEREARQKDLDARKMLGGTTDAGTSRKTPEEQIKEEAEKQAKEIASRFN